MDSLFLNEIIAYNLTLAELIFYVSHVLIVASSCFLAIIAWVFCRPLFPARVNCWFCNKSFWVTYSERNCFDCRFCGQYNGFDEEGDYNIDVLKRNRNGAKIFSSQGSQKNDRRENGLCKSCNVNQRLKVQQLAAFTPMDESNYEHEIEHFKHQLEKSYRLCKACNTVLTQTLQTQQYNLMTQRLNAMCPSGKRENIKRSNKDVMATYLNLISITGFGLLSLVSSFSLLLDLQCTMLLDSYLVQVYESVVDYTWVLSGLGTISFICHLTFKGDFGPKQKILISIWLAVLTITVAWTPTLLLPPLIAAAIGHYMLSKAPAVQQPVIHFPNIQTTPQPTFSLDQTVRNSLKKTTTNPEVEKPIVIEPRKDKLANGSLSEATPRRIETRSQTNKKLDEVKPVSLSKITKSPKKKKEEDEKRGRMFSPPPEVYQGLSSLRLGSPEPATQPKRDKPANYLFEKINFGNAKETNSILKPAQFHFGAPVAPKTRTEPPACVAIVAPSTRDSFKMRRSTSTPSNDDCISELDVTAISPLCDKKFSPAMPFTMDYDYPYSQNCAYPQPIRHTAVYTYSTPSPYPFPFQQRPSSSFVEQYDYPMSPTSSKSFSNSTSHEGDASSFCSGQRSQAWDWGIRILSILSACINLVFLARYLWREWSP